MLHVFVGSPYRFANAEEYKRNINYARALCRIVALNGHVPLAPHLCTPQFLNDGDDVERGSGLNIARQLLSRMDVAMFGSDLGISDGMKGEIAQCHKDGPLYCVASLETFLSHLMNLEREWKAKNSITENLL